MYLEHCQLEESQGQVIITGPCVMTGKTYRVGPVKRRDLDRWIQGAFIQDVMPYLSRDDREFLMSGVSPEAWDRTFPPEEDRETKAPVNPEPWTCPEGFTENQLQGLHGGTLDLENYKTVNEHLKKCDSCQQKIILMDFDIPR